MPSSPPATSRPRGTVATLLRLVPFVRPAIPRIGLGGAAALLAGVVALVIPVVLQGLVDGPLAAGDPGLIWPAALAVLVLASIADLTLYHWLTEVTVCYRCHAELRGFVPNPEHGAFDIHRAEEYESGH